MNKDMLKEFIEKNPKLVRRVTFAKYPSLSVVKYSRNVFFNNLWNDILLECRGLVIDQDYNPVVRPFKKVFNYMENGASYDRDREVYWERKVNGFMGGATFVSSIDEVVYSTTGSLDSDFSAMAEKWLKGNESYFRSYPDITFLFEICDHSDPHIIEETAGAYLIGIRRAGVWDDRVRLCNPSSMDYHANNMDIQVRRPVHGISRFTDVVKMVKDVRHEGFVVYPTDSWETDAGLKIKSPYYLTTKFFARKSSDKLMDMLDSEKAKRQVDEEYYPLIEYLSLNKNEFVALDEQDRIKMISGFLSK